MVTKAIIPAGGLGTRFLPATKIVPKEMLPILDKPAIQYIVEEGVRSGIKHFVVVTGRNKTIIEDHFDIRPELESFLQAKHKADLLESTSRLIEAANFVYVRQKEPLGLGHAIWSARSVMGNDPMAIFLPDDIIVGKNPTMAQLIQIALQEKCNIVAVQEVPLQDVSKYGIVGIRKQFSPNLFQVKELVEKPSLSEAPSNLAIVGRYVLSPKIFDILGEQCAGASEEIQLTDAIQKLLLSGEKVFAYKFQGERYDTGNPLGFIKAILDCALRHPKYADEVLAYLQKIDREMIVMQGKVDALNSIKIKPVAF